MGPISSTEPGLRVYTTLDLDLQTVANNAILGGTAAYERRHGWKGRLQNIVLSGLDMRTYRHPDWTQTPEPGAYFHALVVEVTPKRVTLKTRSQTRRHPPGRLAMD